MQIRVPLILISFLCAPKLYAGVSCTKNSCAIVSRSLQAPLLTLDPITLSQITKQVLRTFAEEDTLSNLNSRMIGKGSLDQPSLGIGFTVTSHQNQNIDSPYTLFPEFPNAGESIVPNLSAGIPLGWLVGYATGDPLQTSSSWNRLYLYLHGFRYDFGSREVRDALKSQNYGFNLNGDILSYGFQLRYELFPGREESAFQGLTIGAGISRLRQDYTLLFTNANTKLVFLGQEGFGFWNGAPRLEYFSEVVSIPLDFRARFQPYKSTIFFTGFGTTWNRGSIELNFQKEGPVLLNPQTAVILDRIPVNFQPFVGLLPGLEDAGKISSVLQGIERSPKTMNYWIAGMEIRSENFSIQWEGLFSTAVRSLNLGLKFFL